MSFIVCRMACGVSGKVAIARNMFFATIAWDLRLSTSIPTYEYARTEVEKFIVNWILLSEFLNVGLAG